MLVSVQYARAVAALLVVIAHLSGFQAFKPITAAHFGGFGVDIFFVISGFIMWETSKQQSPIDFMQRRFARIVPPYWFYTTLLVIVALLVPRLAPNIHLDWKALLGSYLFLPYTDHLSLMNPILLQGWTLNYEMYFYTIFALSLFLKSRRCRFVSITAFFLVSALVGPFVDRSWALLAQVTSTDLLEFVFGMMVSIAWHRSKIGLLSSSVVIAASAAVLTYAGIQKAMEGPAHIFGYGIPSAFLLFGLLGIEGQLSKKPQLLLLAIGNSSYSLYLAHPFILSSVHYIVDGPVKNRLLMDGVPLAIIFGVTAVIASLLFSYLSFRCIEKPMARAAYTSFARFNRGAAQLWGAGPQIPRLRRQPLDDRDQGPAKGIDNTVAALLSTSENDLQRVGRADWRP